MVTKARLQIVLVVVAIAISIFSFHYLRLPFVWLSLLWLLVAFCEFAYTKNTVVRYSWLYVGVSILAFGAYESYLWMTDERARHLRRVRDYNVSYARPLGYAPPHDTILSDEAYWKKEQIYRVSYAMDEHGLRLAPWSYAHDPNRESVLFFGGSVVFGQGVDDDETLPYLVGHFSDGRYYPYNFGFIGYGAHQMLAILEHKLDAGVIEYKPRYGIYLAIIDHINRAKGRAFWDQYGPRYVLTPDGHVQLGGFFDDYAALTVRTKLREKSLVFRRILYQHIGKRDIQLFLGIVDAARRTFQSRYPGGTFHVILWDRKEWGWDKISEVVQKGLSSRKIDFHPVREILPDFDRAMEKYTLHRHDYHPTPLAHRLLAQYVVDNILEK